MTFSAEENALVDFVSVMLANTEDTWQTLFKSVGNIYQNPVLVA
jgi:predicted metalloprotease